MEKYQEVIEDIDFVIKTISNKDSYSFCLRGSANYGLERIEEAMKDFDEAINLDPKNARNFHNRGLVKFGLDQKEGALKDFSIAIILSPQKEYLEDRSSLRFELGDYYGAIKDFNLAKELKD